MKVLIIEDEPALAESIIAYLEKSDYRCELAPTFDVAKEKIQLYRYDCILLDITLPGGHGLDILSELRSSSNSVGVIIISAKDSLDDKVRGLNIGADDYLAKPFHLAELGARLKALVRRKQFGGEQLLSIGSLEVDVLGKVARVNRRQLELTKSEFDLLLFLISNKNKVISRNAIGEHLSGDDADRFDNFDYVYSHIKNLKKKLAEAGSADYIKTVYGLGYKFEI